MTNKDRVPEYNGKREDLKVGVDILKGLRYSAHAIERLQDRIGLTPGDLRRAALEGYYYISNNSDKCSEYWRQKSKKTAGIIIIPSINTVVFRHKDRKRAKTVLPVIVRH